MKQATWNVRSELVFIGVAFLLLQGCSNANLKVNSSSSVAGSADQPKKINYQFEIAATDGSKYGVLNHDSNQNFYFHMENEDKFVWINRNKILDASQCIADSSAKLADSKTASSEMTLKEEVMVMSKEPLLTKESASLPLSSLSLSCYKAGISTSITTAYQVFFTSDNCEGQKYIVSAAGPNSSFESYSLLPNPIKGLLYVLSMDETTSSYQIDLHETAGYSGPIKFMSAIVYGSGMGCTSLTSTGGVNYLDSLKINPSSVNIQPLLDQRPFVDY